MLSLTRGTACRVMGACWMDGWMDPVGGMCSRNSPSLTWDVSANKCRKGARMPGGYWEITMQGRMLELSMGFPFVIAKYMTGFHWIRLCTPAEGNLQNYLVQTEVALCCSG